MAPIQSEGFYQEYDYYSHLEELEDQITGHELAIRKIVRIIENAKYYGKPLITYHSRQQSWRNKDISEDNKNLSIKHFTYCFNCNKKGHIPSECQTCERCQKGGHTQ